MEPSGRDTLVLSYQLLALCEQAKLWCLGWAWLEGVQRTQLRRWHHFEPCPLFNSLRNNIGNTLPTSPAQPNAECRT